MASRSSTLPRLRDALDVLDGVDVVEVWSDSPDQDVAGVLSVGLGLLARERGEVTTVARREPSLLGCGQLERLWVGESLECRIPDERERIVTRPHAAWPAVPRG